MAAIFIKGSGARGEIHQTLVAHRAGSNQTTTHTFSHDYEMVTIDVGGYGTISMTTGSGWSQTHSDNTSSNRAIGWIKTGVHAGETVAIKCNDRYGIAIRGFNVE